MFDIKGIICIIVLLVVSVVLMVIHPKMHKQAIITDAEYGIMQIEAPVAEWNPEQAKVNIVPQQTETRPVQVQQYSQPKSNIRMSNVNAKPKSTTFQQPVKPKQQVQNKTAATAPKPVQQPKQEQKKEPKQSSTVPQPKTVDVKPTQNIENKEPRPYLTEQEEIIAWNRWHSRIQNQIMMDSNVRAPLGTRFYFTFTVDKFGNLSNVKVWADPSTYTDYAVRCIKPVIMGYRNKPVLTFPDRTRRIINNFNGKFVISRTTQYSTPENYHDYEHVKH